MECMDNQKGLNCDYGTEECCGETFPEIRYTCGESNLWAGYFLHHCQGRGVYTASCTGCPQVQPDSGTEECCGETFPEIRYTCGESNLWAGYFLHHCQGIHRGVLDCPTATTTTTTTTGCPTGWVEQFG